MNNIEANSNWLTWENNELKDKFYKLSNEAVVKDFFDVYKQESDLKFT